MLRVNFKKTKVVQRHGVIVPNGEVTKEFDWDGYKYLRILEMDKFMEDVS